MAHVAILGQQRPLGGTPKRKRTLSFRFRFGFVSLAVVTILLATTLSILYFLQVNKHTMAGYLITEVEDEIQSLKKENKTLEYHIADRQNLTLIENEARNRLGMIDGEVAYWWLEDGSEEIAQSN